MAFRTFFTILAVASAASYVSASTVTTLSLPVPAPTGTASGQGSLQFKSLEFHPIGTAASGRTTFVLSKMQPTPTSGATSGSASASATPVLGLKIPDLLHPAQTLIVGPTDSVMKVGVLGVGTTQSCQWAPGPSPTATCVEGAVGVSATSKVPVVAVAVTMGAQLNGASAASTAPWVAAGAAAVGVLFAL